MRKEIFSWDFSQGRLPSLNTSHAWQRSPHLVKHVCRKHRHYPSGHCIHTVSATSTATHNRVQVARGQRRDQFSVVYQGIVTMELRSLDVTTVHVKRPRQRGRSANSEVLRRQTEGRKYPGPFGGPHISKACAWCIWWCPMPRGSTCRPIALQEAQSSRFWHSLDTGASPLVADNPQPPTWCFGRGGALSYAFSR
ncbi:hypothetical protein BJV74DRAFT_856256 [Russula compacta]|nr:hypothetical protein BJV74DRAFT_856256 [Russula compacta]